MVCPSPDGGREGSGSTLEQKCESQMQTKPSVGEMPSLQGTAVTGAVTEMQPQ